MSWTPDQPMPVCSSCGSSEADPDMGLCFACFQRQQPKLPVNDPDEAIHYTVQLVTNLAMTVRMLLRYAPEHKRGPIQDFLRRHNLNGNILR